MMVLTIDSKYEVELDCDEETLRNFLDSIDDIECIYVYNEKTKILTLFGLREL